MQARSSPPANDSLSRSSDRIPGKSRGTSIGHPNLARFAEPTVEGVDFPSVRVRVARFDRAHRRLDVELAAGASWAAGRTTEFKVTRLPRGARFVVVANDGPGVEQRAVDGTLSIRTRPGERLAIHRQA